MGQNGLTYAYKGSEYSQKNQFGELKNELLKCRMQPEDQYEIAVLLESMGWNDSRVLESFGAPSVFNLASDLWEVIQKEILIRQYTPEEKNSFTYITLKIIKSFLRGIIFALPMAISVIAMLTLKFSLWSYKYLSLDLATSIALGTVLSFMTVGGFTQSIARRGFFYIRQGYYNMARRITFYFVRKGFIICILLSVLFFIIDLFWRIFSIRMIIIADIAYFFLCAIWLSVTIMYILEREIVFTGLIAAGISVVYILFKLIKLKILFSQLISLILVSFFGIVISVVLFKQAEAKMERGIAPSLPRMSITLYSVMPYFIYGFWYFTFFYTDRVLAWSTNNYFMPYYIWFRGAYELGLDFALLMLIVPMGFNEVMVEKLMADLEINQKNHRYNEIDRFKNKHKRMYTKNILIVSGTAAVSAILVYTCVKLLDLSFIKYNNYEKLLSNATTEFVFVYALIAYTFLSIGLMNAVILFSLSQPQMINRCIIPASAVNFIVGFVLSRRFDYSFAVFGILCGSFVFLILTIRQVRRVLNDLDYYLYAAS